MEAAHYFLNVLPLKAKTVFVRRQRLAQAIRLSGITKSITQYLVYIKSSVSVQKFSNTIGITNTIEIWINGSPGIQKVLFSNISAGAVFSTRDFAF